MIKPLKDRVVLTLVPPEEKTKTGLIIPDTAKTPPTEGVVVACGPGTKQFPMDVKKGDRVVFLPHAGLEMNFDGVDYTVIRSLDIIAVL